MCNYCLALITGDIVPPPPPPATWKGLSGIDSATYIILFFYIKAYSGEKSGKRFSL